MVGESRHVVIAPDSGWRDGAEQVGADDLQAARDAVRVGRLWMVLLRALVDFSGAARRKRVAQHYPTAVDACNLFKYLNVGVS